MDLLLAKSLHLIFMVTWFAALFYLPRLFVYHAQTLDQISKDRFKIMERKLYYGIAWPGGALTAIFGLSMLHINPGYFSMPWLKIKLLFVALTWVYHLICGHHLKNFKLDINNKSHVYFRIFNEVPVISLVLIIVLAVYQPMF